MIIIIEGLDGIGKSTFAKKFAEVANFKYIKESYTDDFEEKKQRILNLRNRLEENKNYIYDRTTLIDDFVYDFLNEKKRQLEDYQLQIFDLLSKCKIFHLTIDEDVRKQRFQQRGDKYITEEMIDKIKNNYQNFYKNLKNVEYFDLLNDNDENVKKMLWRIEND